MAKRVMERYVVIKPDGAVRVSTKPRLAEGEVAIKLNISFPDGWGKVIKEIDVIMPEAPVVDAVEELFKLEEDLRS